jgi:hypothetical protein
MFEKSLGTSKTCNCTGAAASIVDPDTWLDQTLADSFPASDPLATHRFD